MPWHTDNTFKVSHETLTSQPLWGSKHKPPESKLQEAVDPRQQLLSGPSSPIIGLTFHCLIGFQNSQALQLWSSLIFRVLQRAKILLRMQLHFIILMQRTSRNSTSSLFYFESQNTPVNELLPGATHGVLFSQFAKLLYKRNISWHKHHAFNTDPFVYLFSTHFSNPYMPGG